MLIQKEAYFLFYIYIYIVYISINFFFTFPGQAPYTHLVQRHATLALLIAFYSWLAGRHDVIQAVLRLVSLCLHTRFLSHLLLSFALHPHSYNHTVHHSRPLPRWHQSRGGGLGLVQQASNGIVKAVQQGSVAHAEMGRDWDGTGQRLVKGVRGHNWRWRGLAQGCRQIHVWGRESLRG